MLYFVNYYWQVASDTQIAFVYSECLSVMEQSVSIESSQQAQETVRQQLEALSNKLFEEAEKTDDAASSESKIENFC